MTLTTTESTWGHRVYWARLASTYWGPISWHDSSARMQGQELGSHASAVYRGSQGVVSSTSKGSSAFLAAQSSSSSLQIRLVAIRSCYHGVARLGLLAGPRRFFQISPCRIHASEEAATPGWRLKFELGDYNDAASAFSDHGRCRIDVSRGLFGLRRRRSRNSTRCEGLGDAVPAVVPHRLSVCMLPSPDLSVLISETVHVRAGLEGEHPWSQ